MDLSVSIVAFGCLVETVLESRVKRCSPYVVYSRIKMWEMRIEKPLSVLAFLKSHFPSFREGLGVMFRPENFAVTCCYRIKFIGMITRPKY